MDITYLLNLYDRAAANLRKLESILGEAARYLSTEPFYNPDPGYETLRRGWHDCLMGLPKLYGWTVTEPLPDLRVFGLGSQHDPNYSQQATAATTMANLGNQLATYGYELEKARRKLVRGRLVDLIDSIDRALPQILTGVARDSSDKLAGSLVDSLQRDFDEIERLMGSSPRSSKRWADLARHRSFGEGHDWHDIAMYDWPDVKGDLEDVGVTHFDPLPVDDIDLGFAANNPTTGRATTTLPWDKLTAEDFERLLFDLLRALKNHQNVQWLQKTNAADRGRDLSCERVLETGAGGVRTERVIVQAKHWRTRSIKHSEIAEVVSSMRLHGNPTVNTLVFATSGAFTQDSISWVEHRNSEGVAPFIELWSQSHLESLLAIHPDIAAAHHLR